MKRATGASRRAAKAAARSDPAESYNRFNEQDAPSA